MLSEKSQWTQTGTMFVDLDWLLNASSPLSGPYTLLLVYSRGSFWAQPAFENSNGRQSTWELNIVWKICVFQPKSPHISVTRQANDYCGSLLRSHRFPIDPRHFHWHWVALKGGTREINIFRYISARRQIWHGVITLHPKEAGPQRS